MSYGDEVDLLTKHSMLIKNHLTYRLHCVSCQGQAPLLLPCKLPASLKQEQPVRLLGISLSNLQHEGEQLPLFEEDRNKLDATKAMDDVNRKYGDMLVAYGSLLPGKEKAGKHVIPPSWWPEGIKNVDVK